jgi:putative pyruvate formate lyase activating enzyme
VLFRSPVISGKKGICNIFFTNCNLQCLYCQNYQISRNITANPSYFYTLERVIEEILLCLNPGCEAVGFVSPTQFTPHVHAIIDALHERNIHPVTVYNTNGYDKPGVLQSFEEKIDVYLPDLKYLNPRLAKSYSDAEDYPGVAKQSIKEMYRQKGSTVVINDNGQAIKGMIIRHLVLPGLADESINVLRWIATEISTSVYISLMAQYSPTAGVMNDPLLHRKLTAEEYNQVVAEMELLGFYNGWIQEIESSERYNPDFAQDNPFD